MRIWGAVSEGLHALSAHRCTTIAGMLAFFFVLSLAPFLFWLTLLFGRNVTDPSILSGLPLFDWAHDLLVIFSENAADAGHGAGVVFLAVTLWSSTGFFYHLRRSGEILYGCRRKKHGWKVRLSALALTFALLVYFAAAGAAFVAFGFVARALPAWLGEGIRYLIVFTVGFFAAWLLNAYICPYRCKPSETARGSLFTAAMWLLASALFSLYLTFGNKEKLYGALALLVVFLLWLYWMMICFTAGAVFNRTHMEPRRREHKAL